MKNIVKKFFFIIVFAIFANTSAFSISKDVYDHVFKSCKIKDSKFWNAFCTCYTDKLDARFTDEQLSTFLNQNKFGNLKENPLIKRYTLACKDKYKHLGINN